MRCVDKLDGDENSRIRRARTMGEAGRAVFLSGYTREKYLERMREVFLKVAGEVPE